MRMTKGGTCGKCVAILFAEVSVSCEGPGNSVYSDSEIILPECLFSSLLVARQTSLLSFLMYLSSDMKPHVDT